MTRPDLGALVAANLRQETARDDPVDWVARQLSIHLWSKQREILESLRDHRQTAVKSGHGIGKTFTAAAAAAWWIATHPPDSTLVVTTAPTARQVEEVLWQEVRLMQARGHLPGRITGGHGPTWRIGDRTVALGRKPADNNQDAFQGHHARYLLVILDEAGGLPPSLYDVATALATNEHARVLAIGNPTDPASQFAKVCAPGSGWNVIRVSVFDTPIFTGEDAPAELLEELVGEAYVEEAKRSWGEASPIYAARVLGEFPEVSDDTLIPPGWIAAAQQRELQPPEGESGVLGCDIARTGQDQTVIYSNRGGVIRCEHAANGHDLMRTTGEITTRIRGAGAPAAIVDVIGLGAGVVDRLRELGMRATGFNAANRAYAPNRFRNRRAEVYWQLREAFQDGLVDLDPADDALAAQLGAIRYDIDSSGRIYIETKDDMRKRGLPSPDRADAAAMSMAAPMSMGALAVPRARSQFDVALGGSGSGRPAGYDDPRAERARRRRANREPAEWTIEEILERPL